MSAVQFYGVTTLFWCLFGDKLTSNSLRHIGAMHTRLWLDVPPLPCMECCLRYVALGWQFVIFSKAQSGIVLSPSLRQGKLLYVTSVSLCLQIVSLPPDCLFATGRQFHAWWTGEAIGKPSS